MSRNHVPAVLGTLVLLGAIVFVAGGKPPWTGESPPGDSCDIPGVGAPATADGARIELYPYCALGAE